MAPSDPLPSSPPPEPEPVPELADWWVWGVRRAARTAAEILLALRGLIVIVIALKIVTWALTGDAREIAFAGVGLVALAAAWASAELLGRFAHARESPDPERWLAQRDR